MHIHTQLETSESSETQAPEGTVERADRGYEPEPPPALHSIDGAVPPDVLEARAQWLERNPWHPGRSLDLMRERKSLGVPEAAAQLGVAPADLAAVLECREPITLDLALRLEDAGWVLYSTIFRRACFTLGRRDATARKKESGTGNDRHRCCQACLDSKIGIAVLLCVSVCQRTCAKNGSAVCQAQCGPDRTKQSELQHWDTAAGWLRWQVDHDIVAERRRRAALHADTSMPPSAASSDPDADPVAASA